MSADNISVCLGCGEPTLREWWELYSDTEQVGDRESKPTTITVDYRCTCRECLYAFKFEHTEQYPK